MSTDKYVTREEFEELRAAFEEHVSAEESEGETTAADDYPQLTDEQAAFVDQIREDGMADGATCDLSGLKILLREKAKVTGRDEVFRWEAALTNYGPFDRTEDGKLQYVDDARGESE